MCGLSVCLVVAVVGFAGRAVLVLRCAASCCGCVLPVVGGAVVCLRGLCLCLAVRCGGCGGGCALLLPVAFLCPSAACLAVGCGVAGCAGCRSVLGAVFRLRVRWLSAVGSEVGFVGGGGFGCRRRFEKFLWLKIRSAGRRRQLRQAVVLRRQKARRRKSCSAFATPTQTTDTDNAKLGRLCGLASFHSFAGIGAKRKILRMVAFCGLVNQSLRRCSTMLVLLRQAVVSAASTRGLWYLLTRRVIGWGCGWYLFSRRKLHAFAHIPHVRRI